METPAFDLWLEWELYIDDYDPLDDFANVTVTLPDGRCYAMNVWTYDYMRRAPYESLDNVTLTVPVDYLLPPDLFVHRLDRPTMERVVGQLLANGEMHDEWLCPPEEPTDAR